MCEKKERRMFAFRIKLSEMGTKWELFFFMRISESFDFRLGRALCQTVHLFCFWLEPSVGVEFHVSVAVFKQLFQRRFNLKRMRGDRQAWRAPLTRKLQHQQLLPCSRESWQRWNEHSQQGLLKDFWSLESGLPQQFPMHKRFINNIRRWVLLLIKLPEAGWRRKASSFAWDSFALLIAPELKMANFSPWFQASFKPFGITTVLAHSEPKVATSFLTLTVAASLIA